MDANGVACNAPMDPNNVYIGRRGVVFINGKRFPPHDSPWANPFKIGKDGTRDEIMDMYAVYIKKKIKDGELDIETLRGKTLGCWCKPERCHGDVLVAILRKKAKK